MEINIQPHKNRGKHLKTTLIANNNNKNTRRFEQLMQESVDNLKIQSSRLMRGKLNINYNAISNKTLQDQYNYISTFIKTSYIVYTSYNWINVLLTSVDLILLFFFWKDIGTYTIFKESIEDSLDIVIEKLIIYNVFQYSCSAPINKMKIIIESGVTEKSSPSILNEVEGIIKYSNKILTIIITRFMYESNGAFINLIHMVVKCLFTTIVKSCTFNKNFDSLLIESVDTTSLLRNDKDFEIDETITNIIIILNYVKRILNEKVRVFNENHKDLLDEIKNTEEQIKTMKKNNVDKCKIDDLKDHLLMLKEQIDRERKLNSFSFNDITSGIRNYFTSAAESFTSGIVDMFTSIKTKNTTKSKAKPSSSKSSKPFNNSPTNIVATMDNNINNIVDPIKEHTDVVLPDGIDLNSLLT